MVLCASLRPKPCSSPVPLLSSVSPISFSGVSHLIASMRMPPMPHIDKRHLSSTHLHLAICPHPSHHTMSMSSPVLSLKRKRDWCGTCDDDAGSLVQGRGGSCSTAKRTKLRSAGDHVPRTLTLTLTTTPQRHVQLPSQDFTFDSRSNLTTPTSSCRLEQRPSPLSQSQTPPPSEPIPTSQDKCTTEDSTQPEEAGTSVITDLQDSLIACTIEPKSQAPAPAPVHEPFGFDTTLSNVQYGFSKSRVSHYLVSQSDSMDLRHI